jgi:hypothetical protein
VQKNTVMWLAGGAAAYYFLSTRTPVYAQQLDGSYLPATFIDRLTVAITGVAPPPPVPQGTAATIATTLNQVIPALQNAIATTT